MQRENTSRYQPWVNHPHIDESASWLPAAVILSVLILVCVIWALMLDLLPPMEKDSLIHHLAIPKIWLKSGILNEIPWSSFSYYPMNLELLYLLPLSLEADWAAKLIHYFFGLLTALLIFTHLTRKIGVNWGLLGVLIFLSTPIILRLSVSAYVDLGLCFFITLAWVTLAWWAESGKTGWFFVSAIALGLALGTKYNGLFGLIILPPAAVAIRNRDGDGFFRSISWGVVYAAVALAVFSPWLVKNFIFTGNPIYPLFNAFFGLDRLVPEGTESIGVLAARKHLYGESLASILLVPLRVFFSGVDHDPRFFSGVLNPILIIFPILALIKPPSKGLRAIALMAVLWILLVYFQAAFRARYLVPILPVLSVLTVFGLFQIKRFFCTVLIAKTALVLAMAASLPFLYLNTLWAVDYWQKIDPADYLSGKETRRAYLMRKVDHYPIMDWINRNLPERSRILFLFAGNRGYYSNREYYYSGYFSGESLRAVLSKAESGQDLHRRLKSQGTSHILTRSVLLRDYLRNNFRRDRLLIWNQFVKQYIAQIQTSKGFTLYELK